MSSTKSLSVPSLSEIKGEELRRVEGGHLVIRCIRLPFLGRRCFRVPHLHLPRFPFPRLPFPFPRPF